MAVYNLPPFKPYQEEFPASVSDQELERHLKADGIVTSPGGDGGRAIRIEDAIARFDQVMARLDAKQRNRTSHPGASVTGSRLPVLDRLDMLLPAAIREDVQLNLDEIMPAWIETYGDIKARRKRQASLLATALRHYWSALAEKVGRIFGR